MSLSEKALLLKEDIDEVFEAGKQAENAEWWDGYIKATNDNNYLFSDRRLNEQTFTLPAGTRTLDGTVNYFFNNANIADLSKCCKEKGIVFDLTNVTSFMYAFSGCASTTIPDWVGVFPEVTTLNNFCNAAKIKTFPRLYAPKITTATGVTYLFANCSELTRVESINISGVVSNNKYLYVFSNCKKLTHVRFEGSIQICLDLKNTALDVASLKDVISHLADVTGTTNEGVMQLTLSTTGKTQLNNQGATSPNGNTWAQYISDIGWVLK